MPFKKPEVSHSSLTIGAGEPGILHYQNIIPGKPWIMSKTYEYNEIHDFNKLGPVEDEKTLDYSTILYLQGRKPL